jgi:hypothetical protein
MHLEPIKAPIILCKLPVCNQAAITVYNVDDSAYSGQISSCLNSAVASTNLSALYTSVFLEIINYKPARSAIIYITTMASEPKDPSFELMPERCLHCPCSVMNRVFAKRNALFVTIIVKKFRFWFHSTLASLVMVVNIVGLMLKLL